ncbi:hypothetical protein BJ138DRAFT_1140032 [Hygrophoropsis aurantiaca]|uniref:Uncharacterized protein n=1 Tax=Hygrophoropsis aurantiaca TaxID=72124 RepID=A0ACB8AST5_9AGAM|nr:hypothetical protein BJ138DRAFT_1140032 [Hygrophoropsis aurantiaca]
MPVSSYGAQIIRELISKRVADIPPLGAEIAAIEQWGKELTRLQYAAREYGPDLAGAAELERWRKHLAAALLSDPLSEEQAEANSSAPPVGQEAAGEPTRGPEMAETAPAPHYSHKPSIPVPSEKTDTPQPKTKVGPSSTVTPVAVSASHPLHKRSIPIPSEKTDAPQTKEKVGLSSTATPLAAPPSHSSHERSIPAPSEKTDAPQTKVGPSSAATPVAAPSSHSPYYRSIPVPSEKTEVAAPSSHSPYYRSAPVPSEKTDTPQAKKKVGASSTVTPVAAPSSRKRSVPTPSEKTDAPRPKKKTRLSATAPVVVGPHQTVAVKPCARCAHFKIPKACIMSPGQIKCDKCLRDRHACKFPSRRVGDAVSPPGKGTDTTPADQTDAELAHAIDINDESLLAKSLELELLIEQREDLLRTRDRKETSPAVCLDHDVPLSYVRAQ